MDIDTKLENKNTRTVLLLIAIFLLGTIFGYLIKEEFSGENKQFNKLVDECNLKLSRCNKYNPTENLFIKNLTITQNITILENWRD